MRYKRIARYVFDHYGNTEQSERMMEQVITSFNERYNDHGVWYVHDDHFRTCTIERNVFIYFSYIYNFKYKIELKRGGFYDTYVGMFHSFQNEIQ